MRREIAVAFVAYATVCCAGAFAAGINADAVNELTPDAGVTVDGVAVKDGAVTSGAWNGTAVPVANGGTGADNATDARANLNVGISATGTAHVVVQTTNNAVTNAANLLAAYAAAKLLTPGGVALSNTNRAVVLVPPGPYDLGGTTLTLDTEFVDLVGLSTAHEDQYIYGASSGSGTGVLGQTAGDVRIENLLVHCTRASGGVSNNTADPAAYFPISAFAGTIVRNCEFRADDANAWSMRVWLEYKGTYKDCAGGNYAFGGYRGTASGVFTNCSGGTGAFGGHYGSASGVFSYCTGGSYAFGGNGFAGGNFTTCTGGDYAFAGNSAADGTFTNCTGGNYTFGGNGGTANGTFTNCIGGASAFGGSGVMPISGKFYHCTGGAGSFSENGAAVQLFCIQNGAQYPGNN